MLYTLQALSEDDRKLWMDVMDGKEPVSEDKQQHVVCSFFNPLSARSHFVYLQLRSMVPTCKIGFLLWSSNFGLNCKLLISYIFYILEDR